jgi:hypothetical protein
MVNVVMKLLRRDPAQRFQSARELRDTLQSLARGGIVEATLAPPPEEREAPQPSESGASPPGPRPRPRSSSRSGRIAATILLLAAAGATVWARPWGRSLDVDALVSQARAGAVPAVWLADGGMEGGIRIVPLDAASELVMPFYTHIEDGELADAVSRLREAGATVDVSWEASRLTSMALEAQSHNRYFGLEGGDVRTYAQRLAQLVPDSPEAASLLLKVGERMAWDAEAALAEGPPERARELVRECLSLVPHHPRCLQLSGSLP